MSSGVHDLDDDTAPPNPRLLLPGLGRGGPPPAMLGWDGGRAAVPPQQKRRALGGPTGVCIYSCENNTTFANPLEVCSHGTSIAS